MEISMEEQREPEVGHYSSKRTRRGNAQVGRLSGKSNLRIAKDMQGLKNLNKGKHIKKKFASTEKLVLERQSKG